MQSVSIPYRSTKIYIYIYILSKELFFSRFDSNTFLSSPYFQAKSDLVGRVNTTTLRSGILVYELHRILLPVSIRNFNRSHNRVSPKSIPFSILLLSFLPPLPPPPCFHRRIPDKAVQGLWLSPVRLVRPVHAAGCCSAIEGEVSKFKNCLNCRLTVSRRG